MKTSMMMKQLMWSLMAVGAVLLAGCGPVYTDERWYARNYYSQGYAAPRVQAQVAVETVAPDPHFTDLTPYGMWEMTPEYGRIWVPYANRTPGWRPYFYGSWQYTEWGWSWVSDEAWGAGPYHYGRWTWMNGRNWVWVPDYTWGPAWVTWSHGGGCVGWAPMGPGGATYVDIHAHYTYWNYVPTAQFGTTHVQHVVVAAADVPRIHQQTVVVDNSAPIRGAGGQVVTYNAGPPRDTVQQWTARPVTPRAIDQTPQIQPRRIPDTATTPSGGSLGTATQPPPTRQGPPVTPVATNPTVPDPRTGTPVTPQPRPGVGTTPTTPVTPTPVYTPPTRPGVGTTPTPVTPTTPPTTTPPVYTPPTRPGVGTTPTPVTPPTTTPPVYTPPTRPGVGTTPTPTPEPPTRPGAGSVSTDPPTRPGSGYTGPGPINVAPQPTVPRPTPPPADSGNFAPPPARYTPPAYTPPAQNTYNPAQPTRPATPSYNPAPAYSPPSYNPAQPTRPTAPSYNPAPTYNPAQPTRPSTPTYNPAPTDNPAPSYQPSRPSYNPSPAPSYSPPAQRFSPPPAFNPAPSRPAAAPVPAPTRRR